MKKNLLIAGLVLTIATSVISGTMAAYNASVGLDEDTVVAKAFVLTAEKNTSNLTETTGRMAPGDEKVISFTVSNKEGSVITETDMDVVIDVKISNDNDEATPLTYKLYAKGDRSTVLKEGETADKSFSYTDLTLTGGSLGMEVSYDLVIDWPFGEIDSTVDTTFQNEALDSIKITVSGTQVQP